ncbi:Cysteine/O-acetylserine efflux protein [Pararobbsia alpina]|uniref:LysE family translocator n=1 Tax=Pararobbsia alpina TaxID=621374 RepID=UPI0039A545E2
MAPFMVPAFVPLSELGLFLLGVFLVLVMPGPTNTLLAAAGLERGFRRSARLTLAESAGYFIAISFWGMFLAQLAHGMPWLPLTVRLVSAVYIAYLAVRMWSATLDLTDGNGRAVDMRALFVATLLNPKAILFGGTIFPKAAFMSIAGFAELMGGFLALLFPIGLLWIALGSQLGRGRLAWLKPVYVLRGASVVLAAFSVTVAWSAIH